MTAITDLPEWALRLLESEPVADLGMLDRDDHPRVLPITFAVAAERLWSAIDEKPKRDPARPLARIGFLRRRPAVAVTVDHYEADWSRLAWVQVLGRASLIELGTGPAAGDDADAALRALTAKYEQYRPKPPPGPLLRIDVVRTLCWRA